MSATPMSNVAETSRRCFLRGLERIEGLCFDSRIQSGRCIAKFRCKVPQYSQRNVLEEECIKYIIKTLVDPLGRTPFLAIVVEKIRKYYFRILQADCVPLVFIFEHCTCQMGGSLRDRLVERVKLRVDIDSRAVPHRSAVRQLHRSSTMAADLTGPFCNWIRQPSERLQRFFVVYCHSVHKFFQQN